MVVDSCPESFFGFFVDASVLAAFLNSGPDQEAQICLL